MNRAAIIRRRGIRIVSAVTPRDYVLNGIAVCPSPAVQLVMMRALTKTHGLNRIARAFEKLVTADGVEVLPHITPLATVVYKTRFFVSYFNCVAWVNTHLHTHIHQYINTYIFIYLFRRYVQKPTNTKSRRRWHSWPRSSTFSRVVWSGWRPYRPMASRCGSRSSWQHCWREMTVASTPTGWRSSYGSSTVSITRSSQGYVTLCSFLFHLQSDIFNTNYIMCKVIILQILYAISGNALFRRMANSPT